MKEMPQISDSEWEIMKMLWTTAPLTANEVYLHMKESKNWKHTTVKTLLSRLVKKEAVKYEKRNREYFYFPIVSEDECIQSESASFVNKVYSGAVKTMIANFLETEDLTSEEIQELKNILDQKKD